MTASSESTALETFQTLFNAKLSGIAIVDPDGAFVSNVSSSDLKVRKNSFRFAIKSGSHTQR